MRIDVLTLFPSIFSPLNESIIGRAINKGILDIRFTDIRDFTSDKHRTVDDSPYGGGAGMVMKADVLEKAIQHVKLKSQTSNSKAQNKSQAQSSKDQRIILLSPSGRTFDQKTAGELSKYKHLIFICGHYEGLDERVKKYIDDEISIGDYVLTGGELPAMVVIDSLARLIPGVLGDETSSQEESFSNGLLEYPHYTKPNDHEGMKVPEILMSGNHKKIAGWRRRESIKKTFFERPDLLAKAELNDADKKTLAAIFTGDN